MQLTRPISYPPAVNLLLNNSGAATGRGTNQSKLKPVDPVSRISHSKEQSTPFTQRDIPKAVDKKVTQIQTLKERNPSYDVRNLDYRTQSALSSYNALQNQPQKDEQSIISEMLGVDYYI